MFGWQKKSDRKPASKREDRDTLFGDLPLEEWAAHSGDVWNLFAAALRHDRAKHRTAAVAVLKKVLATPKLESRHYLEAWHSLRQWGSTPDDDVAKQVLGVVVEVGMAEGVDLLAAYADGSTRYYNYSGGGIVVDAPEPGIQALVNDLLAESGKIIALIGPWDKPRPAPPGKGSVRLNFLTPSGLHFGQAPINVMSADPKGAAVFHAAARLMKALVELREAARAKKP